MLTISLAGEATLSPTEARALFAHLDDSLIRDHLVFTLADGTHYKGAGFFADRSRNNNAVGARPPIEERTSLLSGIKAPTNVFSIRKKG